jgi:hypothetical protein
MWREFVQGPVVGVCEGVSRPLGFTNCGEFLDQLSDH